MAVIKKNEKYFELQLQVSRQYGAPLDKYSVFYSFSDAQEYASNNPLAYVGQVITVVDETNETSTVYVILDTSGTLSKLSATDISASDAGEIIIADNDGSLTGSGVTIGGTTLSNNPSPNVVATEAAVSDAISWKPIN